LVAIIGILPAGMTVQKDNREDTIISQDAPYFLDAIRNGAPVTNGVLAYYSAQGLDFLTNYVQSIQSVNVVNGTNYSTNWIYPNARFPNLNGAEIIGLLTTPQNNYNSSDFALSNLDTVAIVRALGGPATEQNGLNSIVAFTYQMEVMVTPFNNFAPDTTNWYYYSQIANVDSNLVLIRSNRWLEANPGAVVANSPYLAPGTGALAYNLFDVRLRFSWPVIMNGTNISVGPGRQTYRTMVAAPLAEATANEVTNCWFFQLQTFTNIISTNISNL